MIDSTHAAGFERGLIRGQTLFFRHHKVGQGVVESSPAETATAVETKGVSSFSTRRVVETESPTTRSRQRRRVYKGSSPESVHR